MRLEDPVEGELVDILSMCPEDPGMLTTMFIESSEERLVQAGGTLPDGVRLYLARLESRGVIAPCGGDDPAWELTATGRRIADDRRAAEERGEDPDA